MRRTSVSPTPGVQADAKRYEAYLQGQLAARHASRRASCAPRQTGAGRQYRSARRLAGLCPGRRADANDAEAWLGLARSLLAIKPDQSSERYELPVNASGAAWNAYERGQGRAAKAAALWVLHEALQRRSYWRPAIDACRPASPSRQRPRRGRRWRSWSPSTAFASPSTRSMPMPPSRGYASSSPSGCAPARRLGAVLQGRRQGPAGRDRRGRQICLDGFAHGKRYEVQVRAGLPSAIAGEKLLKTAELAVYVQDRSPLRARHGPRLCAAQPGPAGHPAGHRQHRQGLRRGLSYRRPQHRADPAGRRFPGQISSYELTTSRAHRRPGLQGELDRCLAPQRGRDDCFSGRRGDPAAGARRLRAGAPCGAKKERPGRRSARHAVVRRLRPRPDGHQRRRRHPRLRALARHGHVPVVNANVRLLARNNEVLGTAKTDSRGYVRFDPGLKRGEGGQAPAVLVAETPDGDYAFLDMATAAFDLTDRGVKGRAASRAPSMPSPTPTAASIAPARPCI